MLRQTTEKKKKQSRSAYSTLCKCLFKSCFWSSGMPHLEGERKKKKTSSGTKPHSSFSKRPTTRNSAPQVQQTCQDRRIARAKAGTPAGTTAGAATRHARLRKEDPPACGETQSRTIGSPSSRSKLLTPAFLFCFLSHRLQISNTPAPHQTACHSSGRKPPPRGARNRPDRQRPFRPPNRSLGLLDLLPRTTGLHCSSGTFEVVVQLRQQAFNKIKSRLQRANY